VRLVDVQEDVQSSFKGVLCIAAGKLNRKAPLSELDKKLRALRA
jgi:hypothetical protein